MKKIFLTSLVLIAFGILFFTSKITSVIAEAPLIQVNEFGLSESLEMEAPIIPEEEVEVVVTINSPADDSVLTSNNFILDYSVTGNPTHCWYDLGGPQTFDLNDCEDTTLELPKGNYVLNLFAQSGENNPDFASIWFEVDIPEITRKKKSSGSMPSRFTTPKLAEEGRVLGASTCNPYLSKYIKYGNKNNDKEEVKKLQQFLNENLGLKLIVDGDYGLATYNAVKSFQVKNSKEILDPWVSVGAKDVLNGTGYVYKTTQRWINMTKCPELNLPIPFLR